MLSLAQLVEILLPILGSFAACYAIGLCFPAEKNQAIRPVLFNLAFAPVYYASLFYLGPMLQEWVAWRPKNWVSVAWADQSIGTALIALWITLAVYDFFYYWWHRAQHTFSWLWRIHAYHHAEETFNSSTGFRQHWAEETLRPLFVAIPASVIWANTVNTHAWVGMLFLPLPFFIHMNVSWRLQSIRYALVSPLYHRAHHGVEQKYHNKNFAAFFPFWDVVFGSAYFPSHNEVAKVGLDESHRSYTEQLRFAFGFFRP